MIEKLKARKRDDGFLEPATPSDIHWKINELVDAVNGILDYAPLEMAMKVEPADPYAEQRRWIGKLCRVEIGGEYRYGILKDVSASHPTHPFNVGGLFFRVCEPVKPDDDIIYKGGDNEQSK